MSKEKQFAMLKMFQFKIASLRNQVDQLVDLEHWDSLLTFQLTAGNQKLVD